MLQGSSRVSVVEESPCDAALVFPWFLIQDVILLTASQAVEQQTETRSLFHFTGVNSSHHQQTEADDEPGRVSSSAAEG